MFSIFKFCIFQLSCANINVETNEVLSTQISLSWTGKENISYIVITTLENNRLNESVEHTPVEQQDDLKVIIESLA